MGPFKFIEYVLLTFMDFCVFTHLSTGLISSAIHGTIFHHEFSVKIKYYFACC